MDRKRKQLQVLQLHHWKERALRYPLMPIAQFLAFAQKCTLSYILILNHTLYGCRAFHDHIEANFRHFSNLY